MQDKLRTLKPLQKGLEPLVWKLLTTTPFSVLGDYLEVQRLDYGSPDLVSHAIPASCLTMAISRGWNEIAERLITEGYSEVNDTGTFEEQMPLHYAADRENTFLIRKLIEQHGAEVNIMSKRHNQLSSESHEGLEEPEDLGYTPLRSQDLHYTPLRSASNAGHVEAVRLLLQKGADPNIGGEDKELPLFIAIKRGYLEVVRELLRGQVRDDSAETDSNGVLSAKLTSANVNINAICGRHGTALHAAVVKGQHDLVAVLISKGADVNRTGGEYWSPLQAAAANKNTTGIELLRSNNADINMNFTLEVSAGPQLSFGSRIFHRAFSALHWAAYHGDTSLLNALTRHKELELNIKSCSGTPLTLAIFEASSGYGSVRHKEFSEVLMKDLNADVSCLDNRAPIHMIAWCGNAAIGIELLDLLVKHGADVNQAGHEGDTPLHLAVRQENELSSWVVETLLERGANMHKKNEQGETSFDLLPNKKELALIKRLLDRGFLSQEDFKSLEQLALESSEPEDPYDSKASESLYSQA